MLLEQTCRSFILGDDTLAMSATELVDMCQCSLDGADGADGHLVVHELRAVALANGRAQQDVGIYPFQQLVGRSISVKQHLVVDERLHQFVEVAQPLFVDDETVQGVAHRGTARLGIVDDSLSHLQVALHVEVGVHHASSRFNDRNAGGVAYEVYQSASATWDAQVDISYGIQHLTGSLVGGRQQCHHVRIDTLLLQHLMDQLHGSPVGEVGIRPAFQHTGIATLKAE